MKIPQHRNVFIEKHNQMELIYKTLSAKMLVTEFTKMLAETIVAANAVVGVSGAVSESAYEELNEQLAEIFGYGELLSRILHDKSQGLQWFRDEESRDDPVSDYLYESIEHEIETVHAIAQKEHDAKILRNIQTKLKERCSKEFTMRTIPEVFCENFNSYEKPSFFVGMKINENSSKVIAGFRTYTNENFKTVVQLSAMYIHPEYTFVENFCKDWKELSVRNYVVSSADNIDDELFEEICNDLRRIAKTHKDYDEWSKNKQKRL